MKLFSIRVDLLVSQYAKAEGAAELAQRQGHLCGGALNASLTGELPVGHECCLRLGILVAALGLAGHHAGLIYLSHAPRVVECRRVGHSTQMLVVPIPDGTAARLQFIFANAALLRQSPVGVLQCINAAPLVIGQMAE